MDTQGPGFTTLISDIGVQSRTNSTSTHSHLEAPKVHIPVLLKVVRDWTGLSWEKEA